MIVRFNTDQPVPKKAFPAFYKLKDDSLLVLALDDTAGVVLVADTNEDWGVGDYFNNFSPFIKYDKWERLPAGYFAVFTQE